MNGRRIGRRAVRGAAALAGYAMLVRRLRPWYNRWGASDEELRKPLPGDGLIGAEGPVSNHAVTIHAPAEEVWPWLVQMGQDRGGFYSYTWLENGLALAGMRNADRIHAEWQDLEAGDRMRLASRRVWGDLPLLPVAEVEPNRHLVLQGWGAFVLEPVDEQSTRLIVRSHGAPDAPGSVRRAVDTLVFEPAHFVMERRMLLGIKERAERAWAAKRAEPAAA
jgi:hypothetical protein